jgi:hypothetical protein
LLIFVILHGNGGQRRSGGMAAGCFVCCGCAVWCKVEVGVVDFWQRRTMERRSTGNLTVAITYTVAVAIAVTVAITITIAIAVAVAVTIAVATVVAVAIDIALTVKPSPLL